MNEVSSTQVHKIRKYSGYARAICSVLAALYALGIGSLLFVISREATADFVGLKVAADRIGGSVAMTWMLANVVVGSIFWTVIIWLLRRVFDNFARGQIFHAANVREIRRIAFVVMLLATKKALGFFGTVWLGAQGFFASAQAADIARSILPSVLQSALAFFAIAGIIYLASWIMRVGLGINDEATELRRDAELVV